MKRISKTDNTYNSGSITILFCFTILLILIHPWVSDAARPWNASPLYSRPSNPTTYSTPASSPTIPSRPVVQPIYKPGRPVQPIYRPKGCIPARPHTCSNIGISKKTYRRSVSVYGPVEYGTYIPVPMTRSSQPVTNIYINNYQNQSQQQNTATATAPVPPPEPTPRKSVCPGESVTRVDAVTGAVTLHYTSASRNCR